MQQTINLYIIIFFIYAIAGWIMESTMISIKNKKFVNRGFLIGPICPIYGYGVVLVSILLKKYQDDMRFARIFYKFFYGKNISC